MVDSVSVTAVLNNVVRLPSVMFATLSFSLIDDADAVFPIAADNTMLHLP